MTPDEIGRLRDLCAKASPAPWTAGHETHDTECDCIHDRDGRYVFALNASADDMAFILAARAALPSILDALDDGQRQLADSRSMYEDWAKAVRDAGSEACPHGGDHCSCVGILRKQLAEAQAAIGAFHALEYQRKVLIEEARGELEKRQTCEPVNLVHIIRGLVRLEDTAPGSPAVSVPRICSTCGWADWSYPVQSVFPPHAAAAGNYPDRQYGSCLWPALAGLTLPVCAELAPEVFRYGIHSDDTRPCGVWKPRQAADTQPGQPSRGGPDAPSE